MARLLLVTLFCAFLSLSQAQFWNTYDGTQFIELPSNSITALCPTPEGVWIGTDRGPVFWSSADKDFLRFPELEYIAVKEIESTTNGNIFMLTHSGLLYQYVGEQWQSTNLGGGELEIIEDIEANGSLLALASITHGALIWDGSQLIIWSEDQSNFPSNYCSAVTYHNDDFVFATDLGLHTTGETLVTLNDLNAAQVFQLIDLGSQLLVSTEDGNLLFASGVGSTELPSPWNSTQVLSKESNEQRHILNFKGTRAEWNNGGFETIDTEEVNNVSASIDQDGETWLGTESMGIVHNQNGLSLRYERTALDYQFDHVFTHRDTILPLLRIFTTATTSRKMIASNCLDS